MGSPDIAGLAEAGRKALTEPEAKALLAAHGIAVPRGRSFGRPEEAAGAIAGLRPPFALKVVAEGALHKTDIGGVRLGLVGIDEVLATLAAMPRPDGFNGWLVEEMAPAGLELVVGGLRHARFGPMVMVGLGGIFVEVLDDTSLRICPIDRADAEAMLDELRGAALLAGARGRAPVDRAALVDALLAIGGADGLLMRHAGAIAELDVNPLIVSGTGAVAVDARVVLDAIGAGDEPPPPPDLRPLLFPRAVAVAGASSGGLAHGNQYIRTLEAFGFEGRIYPIHPSAAAIEGLPAVPSLAALPEPVDYAYVAVAAEQCPALLREAGGRVAFAQVMSSGFGPSDGPLFRDLAAAAREGGMRLLGPNCLGTESTRGRLAYMVGADPTPGGITMLAQSGGLSMDLLRRGARRGLAFDAVVTLGDCADLGPADLLPHFLADPHTKAIGLYLEDAPRGRALFERLRAAGGTKPVVLLVGGLSEQGRRAALSHTGALAGDARAWAALARQVGAVMVETLDEMIAALLAFQCLAPRADRATRRVVLFGNGGGASVLAADAFARAGLDVAPLGGAGRATLEALDLPAGASVANPIDVPGNVLQRRDGAIAREIIDAVFAGTPPDAFVIHLNVPVLLSYRHVDILGRLMDAALDAKARTGGGSHVALVLRSDGEPEVEARKAMFARAALGSGIPVFHEMPEAAKALGAVAALERFRTERRLIVV